MALTSLAVEKLKIVGIQLGSSGLSDLFPKKENICLYESSSKYVCKGVKGIWDFPKRTLWEWDSPAKTYSTNNNVQCSFSTWPTFVVVYTVFGSLLNDLK